MSYQSEHQRMKPVLDLARKLDIATNPDPAAIFEAGSGGFQVWCTPDDHPEGWDGIRMNTGAFSKPCEYLGTVLWKWEEETIVGLEIETTAYALADQKPNEYCNLKCIPEGLRRRTIFNRDADIAWLKERVTCLFEEANVPLPSFAYQLAPLSALGPYLLTHYVSKSGEYMVIVSPELDPEEFCLSGYRVAHTLELWSAHDYPADVMLMPVLGPIEADSELDTQPSLEESQPATEHHTDDWLEANFEDQVSGCEQ